MYVHTVHSGAEQNPQFANISLMTKRMKPGLICNTCQNMMLDLRQWDGMTAYTTINC